MDFTPGGRCGRERAGHKERKRHRSGRLESSHCDSPVEDRRDRPAFNSSLTVKLDCAATEEMEAFIA
jgi:hypothetical protein